MRVKDRMTANPLTINPNCSLTDAMEILQKNKFRRLPVVDKEGRLIGIVTDRDLRSAMPSSATTLSVHEANYLLSKIKIKDILAKGRSLLTVDGDLLLVHAIKKMRDHKIGGLPVVKDGQLIGIITETDVYDAFLDIMGYNEKGARIYINLGEDKPGLLADLTDRVFLGGGNILNIVSYKKNRQFFKVILTLEGKNIPAITESIKQGGYVIEEVVAMD